VCEGKLNIVTDTKVNIEFVNATIERRNTRLCSLDDNNNDNNTIDNIIHTGRELHCTQLEFTFTA
jgi:hypothetical protein